MSLLFYYITDFSIRVSWFLWNCPVWRYFCHSASNLVYKYLEQNDQLIIKEPPNDSSVRFDFLKLQLPEHYVVH